MKKNVQFGGSDLFLFVCHSFVHPFIRSFRDRVWYAALASLELTEI